MNRPNSSAPSAGVGSVPAALGVLLVVFGWVSVSGEAAFDDQQAGLNVAILGALVVLMGCGLHLFVYRRRLSRRLAALRVQTLRAELGEGD